MATSQFDSEQYTSEAFVESAGAVLFRLSTQDVCLLRPLERDEYVLPKGRRNCGETRHTAAIREILEEPGYPCRLLRLNFLTRAPPAVETEQLDDRARYQIGICEPFTLQLRRFAEGDIKLIWWYIAAVNEDEPYEKYLQEKDKFFVKFYGYREVLGKLTFEMDRRLVEKTIEIVTHTHQACHRHELGG